MADTWNIDNVSAAKAEKNTAKGITQSISFANPNATDDTLRETNLSNTILKYPFDGQADFPARMKFSIYQIDAYTVDTTQLKEYWDAPIIQDLYGRASGSSITENAEDDADRDDATVDGAETAAAGRSGRVNQFEINRELAAKQEQAANDDLATNNIGGISRERVPGSPIIQLYMPQSLVFDDNVAYNEADLGPGGLTAIAGIQRGNSLLSAVGQGISEGIESIFRLAKGTISSQAAQVAAARVSQAIPKAGLRAAASTVLQAGINPGTRMLFNRPNIRQFTFTFKFIATSAAEAAQVEQIVQTFREEMYPETIDIASGVPGGYKFPNLFKVEFQFLGGKAKVPAMLEAYLRSCQVTYNGSQMSFHADGQPTEIDMTLIFSEYRALSKQDIQKGY